MTIRRIDSASPWEAKVGYSRAVVANGLVFVSATAATDEGGTVVGRGDMYEQTRFILEKLCTILAEAGSALDQVVQTRLYVTDGRLWQEAGHAHREVFGDCRPAMSFVHVNSFVDPDMLIEIELIAVAASNLS